MKRCIFLLLLLCSLLPLTAGSAPVPATEPVIESIHGRNLFVRVPAGFDKVTLQHLVVPRTPVRASRNERWRTLHTSYPRGAEMVVKVRLPTLIGKRFLRVLGARTQTLPVDLLTGQTTFLPDPVSLDDNAGNFGAPNFRGGIAGLAADGSAVGNDAGGGSAPRAVAESDIWKVQGDRLYFYNELRGLQVFDVSQPDAPTLLGKLRMPGAGEDMYLLGSTHAVLLKQSTNWGFTDFANVRLDQVVTGFEAAPLTLAASGGTARARIAVSHPGGGGASEVIIADVRGNGPRLVARVPVDGSISESRLVGSVLYLATSVYHAATDASPGEYGLQLTSVDLANPENPVLRSSIFLGGWANAVSATDRFFLVAKYSPNLDWSANQIDLIDISAPDGTMRVAGHAVVNGHIDSKFQLNIAGDVLTAVAADWVEGREATPTNNARQLFVPAHSITRLQTFSVADPQNVTPLGSLEIAPGETVRAARFDGSRAYVVTFRQVDPLFVVNLQDAAHPTVSGEVEAPGFSTYIEPLGDRLVTIGLVNWRPAISLFDVSDAAAPRLLQQVQLGRENGYAQSEAVWNEKAFKVLPEENLILIPVSGEGEENGWYSRVQLVDLHHDSLTKRGSISQGFSPRRATVVKNSIIAISPSRLVSVNAENRDRPVVKADLEIAWSVDRVFVAGRYLLQLGGSAEWSENAAPTLSVTLQSDAEDTLASANLPNLPIVGATVKEDVFYIAQSATIYDAPAQNGAGNPLIVSAYDLAALPALRLLGSASASLRQNYNSLSAHWPSPGILVWEGAGSSRAWSSPVWYATATDGTSVAAGVSVNGGPGFWNPRWLYANTVGLLAFDFTRPQAPKFLSETEIGKGKRWQTSAAYDAEGMLFLSYKPLAGGALDPLKADPPTQAAVNRHFLLRVDFSEPRTPVIDDTGINVPGALHGVARQGQLLFTVGQNYDLATGAVTAGSALHVSAFDGAAAHLLDVLPLGSLSQPLVIRDETIFTLDAQPAQIWIPGPFVPILNTQARLAASTTEMIGGRWGWGGSWQQNDQTSTLSVIDLNSAGRFTKRSEIAVAHDTSLNVFGDLAVTQDYSQILHLFDASGQLDSLGTYFFDGSVWPDLTNADGGLPTGLWVPLGRYGVETVAEPE